MRGQSVRLGMAIKTGPGSPRRADDCQASLNARLVADGTADEGRDRMVPVDLPLPRSVVLLFVQGHREVDLPAADADLVDPGREPHPGHAQRRREGSHFCGWPSTVNSPGMPLAMTLNVPARITASFGGKITRLLSIEAAGAPAPVALGRESRLRTRPCPDHRTRARPRPAPSPSAPCSPASLVNVHSCR